MKAEKGARGEKWVRVRKERGEPRTERASDFTVGRDRRLKRTVQRREREDGKR